MTKKNDALKGIDTLNRRVAIRETIEKWLHDNGDTNHNTYIIATNMWLAMFHALVGKHEPINWSFISEASSLIVLFRHRNTVLKNAITYEIYLDKLVTLIMEHDKGFVYGRDENYIYEGDID